jgi:hypothetical protein
MYNEDIIDNPDTALELNDPDRSPVSKVFLHGTTLGERIS